MLEKICLVYGLIWLYLSGLIMLYCLCKVLTNYILKGDKRK